MSDIKQSTSFRLNEDDIQKFREFSEQQGLNQAEMFQSLMNTFETAKAKGQITDRAKEVETFQVTVNTLVSMFINSLAINQTSEERIRQELSLELHTKDTSIKDLQEEKVRLKADLKISKDDLNAKEKMNKDTKIVLDKLNKELEQKTIVVDSLQSQLNTLNAIIYEYKEYKSVNIKLDSQIRELTKKNNDLASINTDLDSKLDNIKNMKDFFEKEVTGSKQTIDNLNSERKSLEHQHKQELENLRIQSKEQFEKELEKTTKELNKEIEKKSLQLEEKLAFEKDKMQLEKSKVIMELDKVKSRYNVLQEKNNYLFEELEKAKKNESELKKVNLDQKTEIQEYKLKCQKLLKQS